MSLDGSFFEILFVVAEVVAVFVGAVAVAVAAAVVDDIPFLALPLNWATPL